MTTMTTITTTTISVHRDRVYLRVAKAKMFCLCCTMFSEAANLFHLVFISSPLPGQYSPALQPEYSGARDAYCSMNMSHSVAN